MKLGKYFTLNELTFSEIAIRCGIPNDPPPDALVSLRLLCSNVLDPLREMIGTPIIITSGYRSPVVNRLVGGSANSQHCKGEAADFQCGSSVDVVFDIVRYSALPFDQVIHEFGRWVHVSYSTQRQRRQALYARKNGHNIVYVPVVPFQGNDVPVKKYKMVNEE